MDAGTDLVWASVDLGDARRTERWYRLVDDLVQHPSTSLPEVCPDEAALKAAYRFFQNPAVDPATIREAGSQAALLRCPATGPVLALQDTTGLDYTTHRATTGMGPLENPHRRGLMVHTTLLATADGVPVGIVDQNVWARDEATTGKRHQRRDLPIEGKESVKWLQALARTEERLGPMTDVITVADREADVYELFALAEVLRGDWVIRARHDRCLEGELESISAALAASAPIGQIETTLPRVDNQSPRAATLTVRARTVTLTPPERLRGVHRTWWQAHPTVQRIAPDPLHPLTVSVLVVSEEHPPVGQKAVTWLLLTNRAVTTLAEAATCVGYYRLRWLVERYHFVLKSGYGIERLQLNRAERMERALAVYSEAAWRLLWLTYQARVTPDAPCTVILTAEEVAVLTLVQPRIAPSAASVPTLRTAVRAIAHLGGFLGRRGDGEPGVRTLWRGLRRLDDLVAGYRLAHACLSSSKSCVQR